MSKTTTERNEYGIQHPDDTVTWLRPEADGSIKITTPRSGYESLIVDSAGKEITDRILYVNEDFRAHARALEKKEHLAADTIKPSFLVLRSVLTVYGETKAV